MLIQFFPHYYDAPQLLKGGWIQTQKTSHISKSRHLDDWRWYTDLSNLLDFKGLACYYHDRAHGTRSENLTGSKLPVMGIRLSARDVLGSH